jgi:4-amino-4-deoxy-L-arabinose transferase-like glycosyltransferase
MIFHTKQKQYNKSATFVLVLILLLAAVLRFWNYFEIPFTHDEFSALFRTQFNSLSELIDKGIKVDGHPAGVQMFLYFWVKVFGFSEFWIKLPFTILGVLSVYWFWKIAKEWFSEQVAILASISMACMQFFIMYSQIARPYMSGLFFTLVMVYYWYKIIFFEKQLLKVNYYLWFILGASLCNYNHYFSLLMTFILSLLGFLYIKKERLWSYFLSLFIIALLFLPHLKIFYYQISMGGLGWLGKPEPVFLFNFIFFLVNHSLFSLMFLFIIIIAGLTFSFFRKKLSLKKEHLITFILGTSSAIIGYFYSIYRAPVLQDSVLIFSTPFFLLFIFSFFQKINLKFVYVIGALWSTLLIYSLVCSRQYYHYFYKSIYKETFSEVKKAQALLPNDSTLILCNFRKEIGNFYIKELKIKDTSHIVYPYLLSNKKALYEFLLNPKYKYLLLAITTNESPESFALCHECFPRLLKTVFLDQGEIRIFAKSSTTGGNSIYSFHSFNDFKNADNWTFDSSFVKFNMKKNYYYQLDSLKEYDIEYTFVNHKVIVSKAQIADATAWIYLPDNFKGTVHFVATIEKDSVLLWQSTLICDKDIPKNEWIPISVSLYFPDFKYDLECNTIKIYFWNPEHQKMYVSKTFLGVRWGNPFVYWINNNSIQ